MRRRPFWVVPAVAMAVVVAACGSDDVGDGPPVDLAGETEQGLRVVLDATEDEVAVLASFDCPTEFREPGRSRPSATPVPLEQQALVADVGADGRFAVRKHYVVDGGDGDEIEVNLELAGAYRDDGTASGSARIEMEMRNGQDPDHPQSCDAEVAWLADEPFVRPVGPVVDVGGEAHVLEAAGDEVWALVVPATIPYGNSGDLVRLGVDGVRSRWRGVVEDPASVAFVDSLVADGDGGFWYPTGQHDHSRTVHVRPDGSVVKFPFPEHIQDVVVTDGHLWAAGAIIGQPPKFRLHQLDPATGAVLTTLPQTGSGRLAANGQQLWVTDDVTGDVSVLRAHDGSVERRAHVGELYGAPALTIGGATAWYPIQWDVLGRLDEDGTVTSVQLPSTIADVEADDRGAWVSSNREAVIRRIEDGQVVRVVDVPEGAAQLAIDSEGAVWVGTRTGVVRVTEPG